MVKLRLGLKFLYVQILIIDLFIVIDYECKSFIINDSELVYYFVIFEELVIGYIML